MNAIKRLKLAGLTRTDIARSCGVTRHAVGYWERGRSTPQKENMQALVRLAGEKGIQLLASDFGTPEQVVDH